MKTLPFPLAEQLEMAIDASNVCAVLECLSEICRDKCSHIADNWQDGSLAQQWDFAAADILKLSARFQSVGIPGIGR